ncbi:hypothetical protein [Aliivibrio fischeri]|uniref:hypothetical protein n=1 Tax=Aliivibrio fischeri TaxID=668 RepID=UPI0012DAB00A|nr:hypothetical protein [Aliivibrio fischeri]MUL11868.1 hypothetical protein [Aliivibrio fischeri]MUL15540.1 hypothetical protein [Aliivibrio fischeri]
MEVNKVRISNMPREEISTLWKHIDSSQLNDLILRSNIKELELLFGHSSELGINQILNSIDTVGINRVFDVLSMKTISKILLLTGRTTFDKLILNLNRSTLIRVLKSVSAEQRELILKKFPINERDMLTEISEQASDNDNEYAYYLSEKFENNLKKEAVNRIKSIEEKERYLERQMRAREEQYSVQLEHLRDQITATEKEIHSRQNKLSSIEKNYLKNEIELKNKIKVLEEEYQKQVQDKIDVKVPEFVKSAVGALETKEAEFAKKARDWNLQGSIALGLSIITAIVGLIYGAFEFNAAAKASIDWFFFSFLVLKGLIVVTLFGAWARHAFNIGNAYMHESLKRSDRMHAINFGKLYLEVYGNNVTQSDMKAIFENWNINSDSAFTKIQQPNFEPKTIEQLTQMMKVISNTGKNVTSSVPSDKKSS